MEAMGISFEEVVILRREPLRASKDEWGAHPSRRRFAAPQDDGGVCALRTNRLDIVAVGIDQERGEIARAVIGPRAGGAIVAASGLQSVGVKFLDRGVVGRAERDVRAGGGWPLVRIEPERRLALGAKTGAGSVARTQDESKRRQCRRVEAHAGVQIADFQSDMVVHDDLRSLCAFENARTGDQPSQCRARRSWKILRMPREPSRNLRGETPAARWNVRTKLERSPNPTS